MDRRILITYPFPLGRATGGARMTREIARHLGRAGARVTILSVSASLGRFYFPRPVPEEEVLGHEFDASLAADGVSIVRVPRHPLHWALDGRCVRRAVAEVLRGEPVEAVLSYYNEGAWLPALVARHGATFGYISTWQSYAKALVAHAKGVPRFLTRSVNQRLVIEPHRRADVFFATSCFTRDDLVSAFGIDPQRAFVCPLGVDPGFLAVEREAGERSGPRRFLFFGRLIQTKGVAEAIRALGRLAAEGHDFRLRLVGQGWHEWTAALIREAAIEERVELLPPADDAGLRRHLAWAEVAVLPSHFEAFGLAFAEAQAAGLPVVAFEAGSVPEIVVDGSTGWLTPTGDVGALAAALREALVDGAECHRRGEAGRARVRERFRWERTARIILEGLDAARARREGRVPAAESGLAEPSGARR